VRVHATVHLRTRVEPGATVPIGWIAIGDPARILPPDRHDEIWAVQAPLNFPEWVYGFDRNTPDLMEMRSFSLGYDSSSITVQRIILFWLRDRGRVPPILAGTKCPSLS
jgi:hypothetical protein